MVGKITKKVSRKQWRSPEGIQRRAEAERARVKATNHAFDELRNFVPNGEYKGKKKSKLETLQAAIEYISSLTEILNESTSAVPQLPPQTINLPEDPTQFNPWRMMMGLNCQNTSTLSNFQAFDADSENPVNYSISSDESLNFSISSSPSKDQFSPVYYQSYQCHYSPY